MSLQVCGGSPGPSATRAWEAWRQGKALQEGNRPVLSSTCQLRIGKQESVFDSLPTVSEGIGSTRVCQPLL